MGCSTCLHGQCTGRCQKDGKGEKKKGKKNRKDREAQEE